jgi:hypothetical protein
MVKTGSAKTAQLQPLSSRRVPTNDWHADMGDREMTIIETIPSAKTR